MAHLLARRDDSAEGRSVKVRVYLHAERYDVVDTLDAERIHIDELIREKISYVGYEVEADYWINLDTGEITFDGAQE